MRIADSGQGEEVEGWVRKEDMARVAGRENRAVQGHAVEGCPKASTARNDGPPTCRWFELPGSRGAVHLVSQQGQEQEGDG
jgi:hypothetical protein